MTLLERVIWLLDEWLLHHRIEWVCEYVDAAFERSIEPFPEDVAQ